MRNRLGVVPQAVVVEGRVAPMRPFGELLAFEAALARVLDAVTPLDEAEAVPVAEAVGRVAAETVTVREPIPGFARAMMDGYAVRAADVAGAPPAAPARLQLAGVVHAGTQAGPVEPGGCCQIATGGPIPRGADAVVPVNAGETVGLVGESGSGKSVTAVSIPQGSGSNDGRVGIAFGAEGNRGQAGGQRVRNFVVGSFGGTP